MLLTKMMVVAFRETEYSGAVFNGAWEGPPVSCPMLPHGLHQVEHIAVRTGALLLAGWWAMNFQVLDQSLFGMISLATCLTIVWEVLATTRDLMHVHHVTAGKMLPTLFAHVVGLSPVHPEVPS